MLNQPMLQIGLWQPSPRSFVTLNAEIQSNQVVLRQTTHAHTELHKSTVDFFRGQAQAEQLMTPGIVVNHQSVANKAPAIAYKDARLANLLAPMHHRGNGDLRGLATLHIFQQLHDICWREEMCSHDLVRAACSRCNLVNAEERCIAAQEGGRFADLVELAKDILLDVHRLKDSLHNQITISDVLHVYCAAHVSQILLFLLIRQSAGTLEI
mmetsp:Transcript_156877/g.273035  ORF Transcript_156877/g.273035 Transcript_156877/m.273035 type:complete len:211 (-) Transcript_156877:202-834(-)